MHRFASCILAVALLGLSSGYAGSIPKDGSLPPSDAPAKAPASVGPAGALRVFAVAFPRLNHTPNKGDPGSLTEEQALREVETFRAAGAIVYEAYGQNGRSWSLKRYENGDKPFMRDGQRVSRGQGVAVNLIGPVLSSDDPNPTVTYRMSRRRISGLTTPTAELRYDDEVRTGSLQLKPGEAIRDGLKPPMIGQKAAHTYAADTIFYIIRPSAK